MGMIESQKRRKERILEQKSIDEILSKGGCCLICFFNENPLIIEKHHVAGRKNSDLTISVCPNCHRELSNRQREWNQIWTKDNNSDKIKLAFLLRGQSDVLDLLSKKQRELSNKLLQGDI